MKFNAILILWGLLVGYVAFNDGTLGKLANKVKPAAEEPRVLVEKQGPDNLPPSNVPRQRPEREERGDERHAYRGHHAANKRHK